MSSDNDSDSCVGSDDEVNDEEVITYATRSVAWEFFTPTTKDNVKSAECNECGAILKIKKG